MTPLHRAARMGHIETARMLLRAGAEVNARDRDGKTALDRTWIWTASKKQNECAILLRKHGARTGKELDMKAKQNEWTGQGG